MSFEVEDFLNFKPFVGKLDGLFNEETKKFTCPFCEKKYNTQNSLNRHFTKKDRLCRTYVIFDKMRDYHLKKISSLKYDCEKQTKELMYLLLKTEDLKDEIKMLEKTKK
jgi:hypothetical protein